MLTVCRFCWIASCAMHWSFFLAASCVGLCFRMWRHIRRVLLQCSAIRSILLLYFVPVSLHCPAILGSLRCISTLVASKCMKKKGSPLAMQCYRWSKERIIISLSFICLFYSQSFICSFSPRFPFALHHWLGTIRWGRYHFVGGTFAGRAHCWYQCDSALSRSGLLPLNGDDDDNHAQDQDRPRQGRRVPYQMATLCTSLYHHADSMLIPSNMYISTHLNFLKHLTYFLIK